MSAHDGLLAHHFEDLDQQRDAQAMGMWLFLITEIMFFAGMFLVYGVYRYQYPHVFNAASRELSLFYGGVNTAVLLTSSFTMAVAVYHAQRGSNMRVLVYTCVTMVLGALFLVFKGFEYAGKFEHHLFPDASFVFHGPGPGQAKLFFGLYFVMTGFHALHIVIGLGLLAWIATRALFGEFSSVHYMPVEMVALYWHFVDIVWIYLFPLLYLIDRS